MHNFSDSKARGHSRRALNWLRFLMGTALCWACHSGRAEERLTLNFNPDWQFIKADPSGAAQPAFDDRNWQTVSAPHTYNDGDTFDDFSLPGHRGEQNQWGGRTWYRKTFTLPAAFKGKEVFIEFGAVRQVAEVYLNGERLGICKTGFTPFGFRLTPHLRFGAPNVLAVMCDNRFMKDPLPGADGKDDSPSLAQLSARVNQAIPEDVDAIAADQIPWNNPHWHPAHGGIYRNVKLYVTDPLHISLPLYSFLQTAGPYVWCTDISTNTATVHVEVPVENGRATKADAVLETVVLDRDNQPVLTQQQPATIAAGQHTEFHVTGTLPAPRLWEPDYPYLYRVVCRVRVGGETVDSTTIPLGIRTVRWDAHTGFYINGQHVKLRGWGQKPTDEWPGLGAAQPDWLHFFTLNLMKQAGGNWVRWGHCLAGSAQINACDELGLGVEQPGVDGESDTRGAAWKIRAAAFRDTLIYFRNHPAILIWEGGNQKVTREHARELHDFIAQYDPHGGRAFGFRRADQTTAEYMTVGIGTEGGREIARLPVVEGEYDREESPRRVWDDFSPPHFGYPEAKGQAYDLTSEQYAVNQVAQFVRKLGAPNHCGGANWIFSDSTSGGRVACEVARVSGEVDGVRLPKEAYYVCQAMFRTDPQVHIIGHWNYPAGTKKTVYVASNGDMVELFVNGKSLGRAEPTDRYLFTFPDVVWAPGEIKAVAYTNHVPAATTTLRTAGPVVALRMTPITGPGGLQADGSDVALFDVEAVDAQGERCPTVQQRVDFELAGPATWLGGYNSGKTNSVHQPFVDLECGINRVAIRAGRQPGTITLRARSAGLKPASLAIEAAAFEVAHGISDRLPRLPLVELPAKKNLQTAAMDALPAKLPIDETDGMTGRFTKAFSYSGPTTIVHVETHARAGKNVYVDRDIAFPKLPAALNGADWVQAANSDARYSAADLMEIAVGADTVILVAHDDRLPRPAWLTDQFGRTDWQITIDGQAMHLFSHRAERDESLTLGANASSATQRAGNMYVVFVNRLSREQADVANGPGEPNLLAVTK